MISNSVNLKRQVLSVFKKLHRTRSIVFQNDDYGLNLARNKINEEFRKNLQVTNTESIQELIRFAVDVDTELRTRVAQLEEVEPGKFALKLRPELKKEDNIPYKEDAIPDR